MKVELVNYRAREKGWQVQEKKAILESEEFFDLLGNFSITLFEYGFEGGTQQLNETGYPPEEASPDFLDLHKALVSTPQEKLSSH